MDKSIQGRAMMEILKSCDVIIASGKKGLAAKVGAKLGGTLKEMGVKNEEAKILFQIVQERIFDEVDETDDLDLCVFAYSEEEEDDDFIPLDE